VRPISLKDRAHESNGIVREECLLLAQSGHPVLCQFVRFQGQSGHGRQAGSEIASLDWNFALKFAQGPLWGRRTMHCRSLLVCSDHRVAHPYEAIA
jgi:hypothetical protein